MIGSVSARVVVMAVLWVSVTEASASALGYGLVAVPLVVAASYVLTGRPRRRGASPRVAALRAIRVVELAGWIVWRSLVGGVDVARRALWLPHPDVDPEWVEYDTALGSPAARAALALIANLMPGSLTARIDGDVIEVHVISRHMDVALTLAALERRIARIENPGAAISADLRGASGRG